MTPALRQFTSYWQVCGYAEKLLLLIIAWTSIITNGYGQTEINTWEDLHNVRNNLSENYILNVNLNEYSPGYQTYASASANGGLGWEPLGNVTTSFSGSLNGNGKTISGLVINRPTLAGAGLFGRISGATIINLTIHNASVTASHEVGLVAGRAENDATIANCHVSGTVLSVRTGPTAADAGGFIGYGVLVQVSKSSSMVQVTAQGRNVGGFIGDASGGTYNECFATGKATSTNRGQVGGFAGLFRAAELKNSFALGPASQGSDGDQAVGGFIGRIGAVQQGRPIPNISNNYSIGSPTGGLASKRGGFVGTRDATANFSDNYFDSDVSGTSTAFGEGAVSGVANRTTSQMKTPSNFSGWDFSGIWSMSSPLTYNGYPALDYSSPVGIAPVNNEVITLANLLWITEDIARWNGNYTQLANINAVFTCGWDGNASNSNYYEPKGWNPVGNISTKFTGSYNGDGHTISNLSINRSGSRIGLFGETNGATIQSLGLINPAIIVTGSGDNVGALVGFGGGGTISQCFASGGSVTAEGPGVGGLIGQLWNASLNNSYAIVAVDGALDQISSGLVGVNTSSTIANSYAAGSVVLNQVEIFPGAFITYSQGLTANNGGTIINCFFDTQTTGQNTGGGIGKTTAEMQ